MREETTNRQPIEALPRPLLRAVIISQKANELVEITAIGDEGVRRDVSFFLQMDQELFDRVGAAHPIGAAVVSRNAFPWSSPGPPNTPVASIHAFMSASARSANISLFFFLSRTVIGRSSSSPKFAFIG